MNGLLASHSPLIRLLFNTGCGAVGSAPVWGTGGHRFKSGHPDQSINPKQVALSLRLFLCVGKVLLRNICQVDTEPLNYRGETSDFSRMS